MVTAEQLEQWRRGLRARFPIVGAMRRRSAMSALENSASDPAVVPLLVEALDLSDGEIAQRAEAALRSLRSAAGIDALCALWAEKRDQRLGAIIGERSYIATKPVRVRALSALQAGAHDLLAEADADLARELVAARQDPDRGIAQSAEQAVRSLRSAAGIDALCALWAEKRDQRLGAIVAEQGYIATAPARLRVLTALRCGKRIKFDRAEFVPVLLELLGDPDEVVRTGAGRSLEHLEPGPAQDALCDAAIQNPTGPAAKLCLRTGQRPSSHERACLFLFVTRQLDAYFKEDFEFQNLRLEYERADEKVRGHVMEVVRSGDRRCLGFFGTRKALEECTEPEIKLAIDSWLRHRDWPRVFRAFLELPLAHGLALMAPLRQSGWEPDEPEAKSLLRQVLADANGQLSATSRAAAASPSLFECCLVGKRTSVASSLKAVELIERLKTANPIDGIAIVAALAEQERPGSAAAKAVASHPHWLVRLAGYASGLCTESPQGTEENYWVRELTGSASVVGTWPSRATPADLEALSNAPPEAWTGKLGVARKLLRTLMAHRITTGTFDSMVVEADELAGEFDEAD